jgi:hypothetical protein
MTARHTRRGARGAVATAVSSVHHTRPGIGASAAQHAVWWHRNADALYLIAEHEDDPARAAAVRADAATARTLAAGMAAAHTAGLGEPTTVPASADQWSVLEDTASTPDAAEVTDVAELPDAAAADVWEADLLEVGL